MNASMSWMALVLVLGGCCHFGGHGDDEELDPEVERGCVDDDVATHHEGRDGEHDTELEPCDAGAPP